MTTKLTDQDVIKIAKLARISENLSKEEIVKYKADLSGILDMAEDLQKLDTTGISPLDGVRTIKIKDLRNDEIDPDQDQYAKTREAILNNFPNRKGDLLVVPGVFQ